MKKLRFLFILTIFGTAVSAQVPQGFNYQAVARDEFGNLLQNTTLQVMLYIQSASTGGTIFWKELHNPVVTNTFGLFTVVLGTGVRQGASTVATFDLIDWKVTPKYVKTEIYYSGSWKNMGNGVQLWTVPYALYAKTAKTADFNDLTNKPTTLSGYGITDAVAKAGTQTISGTQLLKERHLIWKNPYLMLRIRMGKLYLQYIMKV